MVYNSALFYTPFLRRPHLEQDGTQAGQEGPRPQGDGPEGQGRPGPQGRARGRQGQERPTRPEARGGEGRARAKSHAKPLKAAPAAKTHPKPATRPSPAAKAHAPETRIPHVKPAAKAHAPEAKPHAKQAAPAAAVTPPALTKAGKKAGKAAAEKIELKLPPSTPEDRQSQLKLLIARGKEQSFLTYAEVNDHLPSEIVDPEQIEDIVQMINDMGIPVYEKAPDAEALLMREPVVADDEAAEEAAAALATTVDAEFGRTTDPVRMYMREMGTVELLTREGEIAIAKRIEEGLDSVRRALSLVPADVRADPEGLRAAQVRPGPADRHHRRLRRPECAGRDRRADQPEAGRQGSSGGRERRKPTRKPPRTKRRSRPARIPRRPRAASRRSRRSTRRSSSRSTRRAAATRSR